MQAEEIRWLFAYDRWATLRVLAALDGVDDAVWTQPHAIGELDLVNSAEELVAEGSTTL